MFVLSDDLFSMHRSESAAHVVALGGWRSIVHRTERIGTSPA
jgi:hypothetical protein